MNQSKTSNKSAPKTFREVQRFRQWYLWAGLIIVNGLVAISIYFAFFENDTSQDLQGQIALLTTGLITLLATSLVLAMRLETRIDRNGLHYKFFPIHRKFRKAPIADGTTVSVVTYHPIREFGGWGIRGWGAKRALNISGNQGMRITSNDGRELLIGTQKPEEAHAYLEKFGFTAQNNLHKAE